MLTAFSVRNRVLRLVYWNANRVLSKKQSLKLVYWNANSVLSKKQSSEASLLEC